MDLEVMTHIIFMWKTFLISAFITLALSSQIQGQESLAVTIYNNDFAMIKDVRRISFDKGESTLYFTDVAESIQTPTVTFKAIKEPESVRVYEQNFEKNLVNTNGILDKYIEKQITIFVDMVDQTRRVTGKLLSFTSGYILETKGGIQIFNNIVGVDLPSLPDGFFTTPTLTWNVWSAKAQTTSCEVAYRTTGFSWSADYSLTLSQDETKADLGGWVTIDNNSGKKYVNAKLKLIAGDVNTVSQAPVYNQAFAFRAVADAGSSFSEKSFADYHLYTLSRPVTLNTASQKQVEFIPKVYAIPVRKYHEINIYSGGYSQSDLKANNFIRFVNSKANGLGIPFPKGIVRVFKEDESDGSLEFIGEDRIDHTPRDQNLTLTTGQAFDITAEKVSVSRISTDKNGGYDAELSMKVTNRKTTAAEVVVKFANSYGDNLKIGWKNAVPLNKISSSQYEWRKVLQPDEIWEVKWTESYLR